MSGHGPTCICRECFPNPPGTEAGLVQELARELSAMPKDQLEMMWGMVSRELTRRGDPGLIAESQELKADEAVVRRLFMAWLAAFEAEMAAIGGNGVSFVDAFMAAQNLLRWIVEDIEKRQGIEGVEAKRVLRSMAVATLQKSLMGRLMS